MTPDAISPGDRIGNCIVGAQVGVGGFGVVYEGRDTLLDRRVAIKVLLDRGLGLTAKDRERLLQEAKVVARLQSPYVVAIYRVASLEERGFALEMEFVDGGSLAAALHLEPGSNPGPVAPLPPERAVAIASQIASALRVAHLQNLVHGDLKPENVLLTAEGDVKLVDFGLAHMLGERQLESTGTIVGTPQYMAPEVIRGEGAGLASDVWSLGVLLHWMSTGRAPFAADTLPALFYAILETAPPPLPTSLPDGLRSLVARCLAKDAAARPNSTTELPALLERALESAPPAPRAKAGRPAAGSDGTPAVAAPKAFGREEEVARVVGAFDAVVAGKGRTVLVTGDVGMGKSTLVRVAAAEAARRGFRWIRVSLAREEGLLRPLFDEVRRSLADDRARARPTVEFDSRTFGAAAPLLRDLLAGDRQPELEGRPQAVWALQHLLQGLAGERPVALVIEGFQGAEAGEIGILRDLSLRTAEHRVLVLATARVADAAGGPGGTGPFAPFADLEDVVRVPLAPLSSDALYVLLEGVLGVRVAPEVARDVVSRAGGNPLFALEILKHMEATGAASRTASEVVVGPAWGRSTMPARLVDLFAARLRGLPPTQFELLEVASVDGMDFDGEALSAVLHRPLLTVLRQLQKLSRDTGLLVARPDGFGFAHALLREVLHDGVAPPYRREIHAALARHLRSRATRVDPERIARHLEAGGDAIGARPFLVAAMVAAVRRQEVLRTIDLATRAGLTEGRLDDDLAYELADSIFEVVTAFVSAGRPAEAEAIYDQIIRVATARGDEELRRRAVVRRAAARFDRGALEPADEAELRESFALLPVCVEKGRGAYLAARIDKNRGRLDEAEQELLRADEWFRSTGSRGWRASTLDQLASIAKRRGDSARAGALYAESASMSLAVGYTLNAACTEVNRDLMAFEAGRLEGLAERLERATHALLLHAAWSPAANTLVFASGVEYASGSVAAAIQKAREAERVLAGRDVPDAVAAISIQLGDLLAVAGDLDGASIQIERAVAAAGRTRDTAAAAVGILLEAQIACFEGALARVPEMLRRAVESIASTSDRRAQVDVVGRIAEMRLYGLPASVVEALNLGSMIPREFEDGPTQAVAALLRAALGDGGAPISAPGDGFSPDVVGGSRRETIRLTTHLLRVIASIEAGRGGASRGELEATQKAAVRLGHVWLARRAAAVSLP